MNYYPYNAPIVLTDDIFILYGGHTGSSVAAQRSAAYFIAEKMASEDINTYFRPTVVTGTFAYSPPKSILLEHGYINRVINTEFLDNNENVYYSEAGISNGHVRLVNDEIGEVEVYLWGYDSLPYKVRIAYETGLPSGTAWRPDILMGLTTYADLILNEIQGYGNEAPGDTGVQQFKNQQYFESRVYLLRTVFGTSARAQFVHKMFTDLRRYRQVGL